MPLRKKKPTKFDKAVELLDALMPPQKKRRFRRKKRK